MIQRASRTMAGMAVPFTSKELRTILNGARRDWDTYRRDVRYNIRRWNETGYWGFRQQIANDMREMRRLRILIAHTKYELGEALNREIQAELKPRIWD